MKEGMPNSTGKEKKKGLSNTIKGISAALAIGSIPHSDTPEINPTNTYAERTIAAEQIKDRGIPDSQQSAYKPGLSDTLADNFLPEGYRSSSDDIHRLFNAFLPTSHGLNKEMAEGYLEMAAKAGDESEKESDQIEFQKVNSRVDAWRLYLGLPQLHNTFGISEYRPVSSKEDRFYYKINSFVENLSSLARYLHKDKPLVKYLLEDIDKQIVGPFPEYGQYTIKEDQSNTKDIAEDDGSNVMGKYTLSKGEDAHGYYISYWDKWDLDQTLEGDKGLIGKPYEIYDRIYYDPQTYKIINPK